MSYRRILIVLLALTLLVLVAVGGCGARGSPVSTVTPEPTPGPPVGGYAAKPEGTPVPIEAVPVPVYPGARLVSEGWDDPIEYHRSYVTAASQDEVLRFYAKKLPAQGWYHRPGNPQAAPGSQTPNYDEYDLWYDKSLQYFHLYITLWSNDSQTQIVLMVRLMPPS